MNYSVLLALIEGYEGSDEDLLIYLNTPSIPIQVESFQTIRSLINNIGLSATDTFLSELESASETIPALKRVLILLRPSEGGIDVASEGTQTQLLGLVQAGLLTESIVDQILLLAVKNITPAQAAGLPLITLGDILFARKL